VNVSVDEALRCRLEHFLEEDGQTVKSTITMNYSKYVVDIVLDEFTVEHADICFRELVSAVAYPYSSLWTRYNEGDRVCYRFLTSREDKTAVYMNIMFS
jgi:hypothetical protein